MRLLNGRQLQQTSLAAVSLGGAVLGWCVFARFAFEDAYITFRYAQNLALGHGLVFQPGEDVLGTSSPLWALMLGLLGAVGVDIPDAAGAISCAALAATAYLGGRMLQREGMATAGFLFAALLVAGFLGVYDAWGMETPLFLALTLGSFRLLEAGALRSAGVLLGAASLVRYEGLAFFAPAAIYCLRTASAAGLSSHLKRTSDVIVTAALVTLPWWVYAAATYGSPFPHTLEAKAGDIGAAGYLALSLRELPHEWLGQVTTAVRGPNASATLAWFVTPWLLGGVILGVLRLVRSRSALPELSFGALLIVCGLALIGPGHCFRWHRLPVHLPLALSALAGWAILWPRFAQLSRASLGLGALVSLAAIPVLQMIRWSALTEVEYYRTRVAAYDAVIEFIQERGWGDELLLTAEPGYVTYHTGNPVIDAAGLVTKGISFGSDERAPTTLGALLAQRPGLILARAPFHPAGYEVVFDGEGGCRLLASPLVRPRAGARLAARTQSVTRSR
ncbi:MAG: hypothetical protein AAGG01_13055 [Planctomycetota bacterium]